LGLKRRAKPDVKKITIFLTELFKTEKKLKRKAKQSKCKIIQAKLCLFVFLSQSSCQLDNPTISQFHQHFMCNFFDDILAPKNYKAK